MSDITKCDDKSCPMKNECYRYRAISSEYRQSYFMDSPRNEDNCDMFMVIQIGRRVKDKDEK